LRKSRFRIEAARSGLLPHCRRIAATPQAGAGQQARLHQRTFCRSR
jgi:hypothetical protein